MDQRSIAVGIKRTYTCPRFKTKAFDKPFWYVITNQSVVRHYWKSLCERRVTGLKPL
jgi:hypothetical protein